MTQHFKPPFQDPLPDTAFDNVPLDLAFRCIDKYYAQLDGDQRDKWLAAIAKAVESSSTVDELRLVLTDLIEWIDTYLVKVR